MLSLRLALGTDARFVRAPRIELAVAISEAYADPTQPPAKQPEVPAGPAIRYRVLVRLREGDPVDAGLYHDLDGASARANEIADQIGGVDGTWPFVHGRFLRPEAITSVDVVEE